MSHGTGSYLNGEILARPARKVRLPSFSPDHSRVVKRDMDINTMQNLAKQIKDRSSQANANNMAGSSHVNTRKKQCTENKEARRRTIWLPADETTVMTIHPGARTHAPNDDTIQLASALESARLAAPSLNNGSKTLALAKAPKVQLKRSVLANIWTSQPNVVHGDIAGSTRGKENIPPGAEQKSRRTKPSNQRVDQGVLPPAAARLAESNDHNVGPYVHRSTKLSQTSTIPLEHSPGTSVHAYSHKTSRPAGQTSTWTKPRAVKTQFCTASRTRSTQTVLDASMSGRSVRSLQCSVSASLASHPVLPNDLSRPELFEDSWLNSQEITFTQLMNDIFHQAAAPNSVCDEPDRLRTALLSVYQHESTVTLYKRLAACLQYGALSCPKGVKPVRLRDDVGVRRQFLDLWLHSYDPRLLSAAAAVVVGRQCEPPTQSNNNGRVSMSSGPKHTSTIERFITAFFIRHDDLDSMKGPKHESDNSLPVILWQRTMLRSLMSILLLDQAKKEGIVAGNLFVSTSAHKSSESVLRALARLALPSIGDISRPLSHLAYKVTYVQHRLQEYSYHIDKLATDLRDGVRLTRLVELLLPPPGSVTTRPDSTVRLTLPSGNVVTTSAPGSHQQHNWPLSKHLKVPCESRVQKLYNVQIALSALQGVKDLTGSAIENVQAHDIVDGHREKTLSLLWSLLSRWGLTLLIDKSELQAEIKRFAADESEQVSTSGILETEFEASGYEQIIDLLKAWAGSICRTRNLEVDNLTTSFADGKALGAIIDCYTSCIPTTHRVQPQPQPQTSLKAKLRSLGCSIAFSDLILRQSSQVPSRTTTISLLALLASRLLPLSRVHRAATTIQRAYKLRLAQREITRRVTVSRLAAECAVVVREREKVVAATVVLQRAWRRVLDTRITGLVRDVAALQALVRAWGVRKALAGSLPQLRVESVRVRGGW